MNRLGNGVVETLRLGTRLLDGSRPAIGRVLVARADRADGVEWGDGGYASV